MGNYSGQKHIKTVTVRDRNVINGLSSIISIDADYEERAMEIASKIIKENEGLTTEELIQKTLEFDKIEEDESTFILNNDSYCSGYDSFMQRNGDKVVVKIIYNT